MTPDMTRRSFLRAAGAVAGAAAIPPLLAGCGTKSKKTGNPSSTAIATGSASAAPSSSPLSSPALPSVAADIASVTGANGAVSQPGFLSYPASPIATYNGVPGAGGTYTAVTPLWGSIPPANNAYYQAVNKALGATLKMSPADGNTYDQAITAMIAGGKLPDWVQLPSWWNATFKTAELVGTQLADLTPYLGGDNIKHYPNLAAIPANVWKVGSYNGKIYGLPSFFSGQAFAGTTYYRGDVFDTKGIKPTDITSIDALLALGKELTNAKGGVWAFEILWTYLGQPFGIPSKFAVDGSGKLTHKYDLPQFSDALNWSYNLAKSGYMNPDALATNDNKGKDRFWAGKSLITGDGTGAWNGSDADSGIAANPSYRREAFAPFAADGKSTPTIELGGATSEISYLNAKLSADQIKECLRIADYLAAPYGSAEYTLINYGISGSDYTMGSGGPQYTDQGKKESQPQTYPFLCTSAQVVSNPGHDQVTKDICAWSAQAVKVAVKPVFFEVNLTVPAQLATADGAQPVEDTIKDVIRGRKKVSDVTDAVKGWKSRGGNDVIKWYQDYADKNGTGQQ
jgi:putative aldouronate transport system substrate-binding protein